MTSIKNKNDLNLFLIKQSTICMKQECIPVGCAPTPPVAATRCQYWGSVSRWRSLSKGSVYIRRRVFVWRGSLSGRGLCPEMSLAGGVTVQRRSMSAGCLCLSRGGSSFGRGSLSRGEWVSVQRGVSVQGESLHAPPVDRQMLLKTLPSLAFRN